MYFNEKILPSGNKELGESFDTRAWRVTHVITCKMADSGYDSKNIQTIILEKGDTGMSWLCALQHIHSVANS